MTAVDHASQAPADTTAWTGYRLSPQQARVWELAGPEGLQEYRCALVVRVPGTLDEQRCRLAYAQLIHAHEVLRTVYRRLPGMRLPLQYVRAGGDEDFTVHQVSTSDPALLETLLAPFQHRSFDLESGPVCRGLLVQCGTEESLLALAHPAVAGDGTSLRNAVRYLLRAYHALAAHQSPPDAGLQYPDAAEWLAQLSEDADAAIGSAYWHKVIAEETAPLRLSFASARATDTHFRPERYRFHLFSQVIRYLQHQQENHNPRAWLLSCWQTVLARVSERERITLAVWCEGREYEELAEALGLFGRFLPVSGLLRPRHSFTALLAATRDTLSAATQWQHYAALDQNSAAHETVGDISYPPYGFMLLDTQVAEQDGPLAPRVVDLSAYTERFSLLLVCASPLADGWCELVYDPALFSRAGVERLARMFQAVTQAALATPDAPLTTLKVLSPAERERVLEATRGPHLSFPAPSATVVDLIQKQVRENPQHCAVRWQGTTVTYETLWRRANLLAHGLHKQGVGPEVRVGIALPQSADALVAILGVLLSGGAYVPIDPSYPRERQRLLREDAGLHLMLTEATPHTLLMEQAGANATASLPSLHPDSLAYVIYTSGSTGRPKGVLITHANLHASTIARFVAYPEPVERYLLLSSLSFDSSVAGIFWTLCQGGTLVLPPAAAEREVTALQELIARESVTHLLALPGLYQILLEESLPADLVSLRTVIVAGERCPAPLLARHRDRLPHVTFHNEYGPTEGTVWSTVYHWRSDAIRHCWTSQQWHPDVVLDVPIGHPVPGVFAYVLDAQLEPVPIGVAGDLYIGGSLLARGYLDRSELTAARFVPDPFSATPGARLYTTGDRARWREDGALEFLGRNDDQVKMRGYRIEPAEIEAALSVHPSIRAAVVIPREDRPGELRLVAYVVPRLGQQVNVNELQTDLIRQFPPWMIPSVIIPLTTFPLGANGKIDRHALLPPEAYAEHHAPTYRAPHGDREMLLARIWTQVLRTERVGVDDNFFQLGGDSLLSLQLVARARQAGLGLTSRLLFQYPTIAQLAEQVTTEAPTALDHADSKEPSRLVPLTPIQQWFFARPLAERHHYNQAVLFDVTRELDGNLLEQAMQTVAARHDALRLRFHHTADGWRQLSTSVEDSAALSWFDLEWIPAGERETIRQNAMDGLQTELDLEQGPVFRAAYFRYGGGQPDCLAWVIHHLAVDAVSWTVLLDDLETAYTALSRGEPVSLGPRLTPFTTWAARLAEVAGSESLQSRRTYWQQVINAGSHCALLPVDHQTADNIEAESDLVLARLPADVSRMLLRHAPRAWNAGVHDLLLATVGLTLARWSEATAIRLDCERHGREEGFTGLDITRTVGWFTVLYPVVLAFSSLADESLALQEALKQLARVPDDGFAYGLLCYDAPDPLRVPGDAPADVLFNYFGQLEAARTDTPAFQLRHEPVRGTRSPRGLRAHRIEIDAEVRDGCLVVEWKYSRALHHRQTIEREARRHLQLLTFVCRHAMERISDNDNGIS